MLLATVAALLSESTVDLSQYLESTDIPDIQTQAVPSVKTTFEFLPGVTTTPESLSISQDSLPVVTTTPEFLPTAQDSVIQESFPFVKRGRGRPKGSKTQPRPDILSHRLQLSRVAKQKQASEPLQDSRQESEPLQDSHISRPWREDSRQESAPAPPKRGRPKGSKTRKSQQQRRCQLPRAAKQPLQESHVSRPDEETETDEDMPPVKRGRGRPKGSKRQRSLSPKPLPSKKRKITSHIHRKRRLYPPCLLDLESVPILESTNKDHIALAETKLQEVTSGKRLFGHPLVIPSFQRVVPPYRLPATLCNLLFFNVLFSSNALDTATGKVSVFPVTIFQDEEKSSGFPSLLIHCAHMKTL